MDLKLDGDGAWPELAHLVGTDQLIHLTNPIGVSCLAAGMQSGKPSVAFKFDLPDGRIVFAETSLALFLSAADAFRARHGDPRI